MATLQRLRLGPKDDGRSITLEEWESSSLADGYRYEIIDGKLVVSPTPEQPHSWIATYIYNMLWLYARVHADVINHVTWNARVIVPGQRRLTFPEPDIAAYHNFPRRRQPKVKWTQVSPVPTVEVLSPDNAAKDLERNVGLYLLVPSIKEYWIVDGITNPDEPCMTVHRRWRQQWNIIEVPFNATYATRMLPGFQFLMNPFEQD